LPVLPAVLTTGLTLACIAAALPIVLFAARFIQGRPAGSLSSVAGRVRWGWLARCLLPAFVAIVLSLVGSGWLLSATGAGEPAVDAAWVGAGPFAVAMAVILVLVPVQAAAEEYLFRGWLAQAVGALVRSPWPGIAVQSVVFALAHGLGTAWGFVDLVAFAVTLGWLAGRTGGLEAGIALHVLINLTTLSVGAAVAPVDLANTLADVPWQMMVADLATLAGYAAAVTWWAGRRGMATTAPAPEKPAGPSAAHRDDQALEQVGHGGVGEVAAAGTHGE
jgi:membrane protease YdiL (CAAX protease family)